MDCRTFRDRHTLYIDELCSDLEAIEMRSHARECRTCGRYDTVVRRGILLMRNLPRIEPSAAFGAGLRARILAERHAAMTPTASWTRVTAYASLAAAVATVSLLAARQLAASRQHVYRMPPVVASAPPSEPSPFGTSALVATVPTGMTIWPAIVMANHAPAHLVAAELASER